MTEVKLMCISNKEHLNTDIPKIEVFEKVTAIDETVYNGSAFWMIKEYPGGIVGGEYHHFWYEKRLFATLPEASSDEMQEQEREAIVNIKTAII